MPVYVACIGYVFVGILHACTRLCAVWRAACTCVFLFTSILHLCCFACIGFAFLGVLHACKRHATSLLCLLTSMHNLCCLLCLLCAFLHAVLFGLSVRSSARTCCLSFWDVICMCILHALVVHIWACFMHAQGCVHVACSSVSTFCKRHGKYMLRWCVPFVFACILHVYCMSFGAFWAKAMHEKKGLVLCLLCAFWHAVLFVLSCRHSAAYVYFMHWFCILGHTSCMHKACTLRCCALLACILHACSMIFAAFRASTTHTKSMQHVCCTVLGLCVYRLRAMHAVCCFVLCLLCAS